MAAAVGAVSNRHVTSAANSPKTRIPFDRCRGFTVRERSCQGHVCEQGEIEAVEVRLAPLLSQRLQFSSEAQAGNFSLMTLEVESLDLSRISIPSWDC